MSKCQVSMARKYKERRINALKWCKIYFYFLKKYLSKEDYKYVLSDKFSDNNRRIQAI